MTSPRGLAEQLLAHLNDGGAVGVTSLSEDPVTALGDDPSVRIAWVDPAGLPSDCSIAAAYDRNSRPARLLVARDASLGRRRFSVLHEYAHHLRNQVPGVLEALFAAAGRGAELEERMCDEFAGVVLLPDQLLDQLLGQELNARAVLTLIASASASAEACAVAAVRRLPSPGYVMLLDSGGTATFTAHNGDVFHVRRDTAQQGFLRRAASGHSGQGREQVRYGTGNLSQEMFVDAASDAHRTVAVIVTDSPPWGGLTAGHKQGPEGSSAYCEYCDHEFTTFAPACRHCSQPLCPDCGRCDCPAAESTAGERKCDTCFLVQPPAAYATASTATCKECSW